QGAWGVIPAHLNELSPDAVRGFLPGFAYQCGVAIASQIPHVQALFATRTSYAQAMALSAATVFILGAVAAGLGPERRGVAFERGRLSETIQCPYHAWTYTLDGALIGAPHMNEVAGFDKRDYPLHPVALAAWEGFLFINLARDPEPFARAFAPIERRFSRFNIERLRSGARIDYDVRANWKLVFQNYSECLHCPVIHPGLVKLTPYTSGENDLFEGPYLGGYMVVTAPGGSLTLSGRACGPAVGDLPAEDRNRVY